MVSEDQVQVLQYVTSLPFARVFSLVVHFLLRKLKMYGMFQVMLGSGDSLYEDWMRATESTYRDKFRGWVGFNIPISHRITAG